MADMPARLLKRRREVRRSLTIAMQEVKRHALRGFHAYAR
jgi:hypothetical protein